MTEVTIREARRCVGDVNQAIAVLAGRILEQIWFLNDCEIEQVALTMGRLEAAAYIVRGACGSLLHERIKARAAEAGTADVKAQMHQVADRWGLDVATLYREIQLYETFHRPAAIDPTSAAADTEDLRSIILEHMPPKWVEEECLRAPDPQATLAMAQEKHLAGKYNRVQLRADVGALQVADAARRRGNDDIAAMETPETLRNVFWMDVRLTGEQNDALSTAAARAGCSPGDLLSRAVRQGLLIFRPDELASLDAQRRTFAQKGVRFSRDAYLADLLRILEKSTVKAGKMAPTGLTCEQADRTPMTAQP